MLQPYTCTSKGLLLAKKAKLSVPKMSWALLAHCGNYIHLVMTALPGSLPWWIKPSTPMW